MTNQEFLAELASILDTPAEELTPATVLKDLPFWDSVAYLSTMVLIDESFGIPVRPEEISKFVKISDILEIVSTKLEE